MNTVIFVGIAAMAAISFGAKPVGYLARIGPAPLRFQSPCKGMEMTVTLPPLVMSDPPATNTVTTTNETVIVEAPAQPAPTPVAGPAPVIVEPAFTPQMLLQFFNRNGTNQEPAVIMPYQFNPPAMPVIPAAPS